VPSPKQIRFLKANPILQAVREHIQSAHAQLPRHAITQFQVA
jgi:hypothetical protein